MRLISATARVAATKMSAAKTCQNWPAENPTLAAVLIQRTVMKAPAPTIRMLATQGASLPRIKVASRPVKPVGEPVPAARSEEHTSELQSRRELVCRLLLEK